MKFRFVAALLAVVFVACDSLSDTDVEVRDAVSGFAGSYFNYDLQKAVDYCTPESRKWIRFVASNILQADVDVLHSQHECASVDIQNIEYTSGDTCGIVTVKIRNFMQIDDIGRPGHIVDDAVFHIPVVNRNGRWLVRMAGPLRSERSYRD